MGLTNWRDHRATQLLLAADTRYEGKQFAREMFSWRLTVSLL